MWNQRNTRTKLNEQTRRYAEQTGDCQRGGEFGGWVKKGKGWSTNQWLRRSHGDLRGQHRAYGHYYCNGCVWYQVCARVIGGDHFADSVNDFFKLKKIIIRVKKICDIKQT